MKQLNCWIIQRIAVTESMKNDYNPVYMQFLKTMKAVTAWLRGLVAKQLFFFSMAAGTEGLLR